MPSHQGWIQTLEPVMVADQTTVVAVSESALWADQFGLLPAQWLIPGTRLQLKAQGKITTAATNNAGIVVRVRWAAAGAPTSGVELCRATFVPSLANSITNGWWKIEAQGTCQAVGTSGSILFNGEMVAPSPFGSFTSFASSLAMPATAPVAATIDTTVSKVLVATASATSSSVSMTCSQLEITLRN